jgi:hypothetical protein
MSEDVIAMATGRGDSIAIAFIIAVAAIKITAFVLGYLIVRLGHDTLVRGVTGDIDFGIKRSEFEVKLISASPGAFFVLAGAAIIIWGLFVDKPFDTTRVVQPPAAQGDAVERPRREIPE